MYYLELSTMPSTDLGIIAYLAASVIVACVAVRAAWKRGE